MEEQLEIQKQFRQQQEKFIYYIIALAVAAIGFSVVKTTGQPLKLIQIPLGLAILFWGLSIYYGLNFLKLITSTLYANNVYFDILQGLHPEVGKHPERIEAASSGIKQAMTRNSDKASKYASRQEKLFYFGIVLFITWHLFEMYYFTSPK
jgi:hypothetical protein